MRGNFLTGWGLVSFSRRTLLHGVGWVAAPFRGRTNLVSRWPSTVCAEVEDQMDHR